MFNTDRLGGEDEEEEEDDYLEQSEIQRRKERLEREQWLREQVTYACCHFLKALQFKMTEN